MASPKCNFLVYNAIPTCACTPMASNLAMSLFVVMPPAMVNETGWISDAFAISTNSCIAGKSQPFNRPSRSTNVIKKEDAYGHNSFKRSFTVAPVLVVHPCVTTSPWRASNATIIRSRGNSLQNSGDAAVPTITCVAPAFK